MGRVAAMRVDIGIASCAASTSAFSCATISSISVHDAPSTVLTLEAPELSSRRAID